MNSNQMVFVIAGFFISASVALGQWVHPGWLYFTGFIGFMMFQSPFTRFCPMDYILRKLGVPPGPLFT